MLRLTPQNHNRIGRTPVYEATYGGAESNVACSLAPAGHTCGIRNETAPKRGGGRGGFRAEKFRRGYGAYRARRQPDGVYYLERGSSVRASKVVYDRADSAIAQAEEADFSWDEIFRGATWFHFTGITAGISENALALCKIAVKKAKEAGLTVSFDPNYRAKLWTKEAAREAMKELTPYVDVLISNAPQTLDVYGLQCETEEETMRALAEKFRLSCVVFTDRISRSADDNGYAASCFAGGKYYVSKRYELHPIVDRVGGRRRVCGGVYFCGEQVRGRTEAAGFRGGCRGDKTHDRRRRQSGGRGGNRGACWRRRRGKSAAIICRLFRHVQVYFHSAKSSTSNP